MRIENFEMERMQSTWENVVEYDLSESGVRPLTLEELVGMGFDMNRAMTLPLGYSQSNGTPQLRELLTKSYPGSTPDHIEVTNGTSEANFVVALSRIQPGDGVALAVPNYMQLWGLPRSLGARVQTFRLRPENDWEPDWDEFERAVRPGTRLVYVSNPGNPTGSILPEASMRRMVKRCEEAGAWLLADEVYLGAELDGRRTKSFWGMSERVIVTSGLSKAYGIPGIRIGWIVGPKELVADCWTQHDYITIGPNKLSDLMARTAVTPENREKLYRRTQQHLSANIPMVREWVRSLGGRLTWTEPKAGALCLFKYAAPVPSYDLCERIRRNQSTLIVPGSHFGLEGHIRIWMGGKPEFLKEGYRRVAEELKKAW